LKREIKATVAEKAAKRARGKVVGGDSSKRIVTLYLDADLYQRLQQRHPRKVSQAVAELIEAYLSLPDDDERSK
jgi:hypothetical protein